MEIKQKGFNATEVAVSGLKDGGLNNALNQESTFFAENSSKSDKHASGCGSNSSSIGHSLRLWREMKQNGFLSSAYGNISALNTPSTSSFCVVRAAKKRAREPKNDIIKKNSKLAMQEEVDKLAQIAAPSGLLTGLNPGIINHVRNKKQVHSIIEALVKSECLQNSREDNVMTRNSGRKPKRIKHQNKHCTSGPKIHQDSISQDSRGSLWDAHHHWHEGRSAAILSKYDFDEVWSFAESSSNKTLGTSELFVNNDDGSVAGMIWLSKSAATVASHWLGLLCEDISRRLTALRRSKMNVQTAIKTELSLQNQKSSSPEIYSASGVSHNRDAIHRVRWNSLFSQMESLLIEEEIKLECFFSQVKEMNDECNMGLQHFSQIVSSDFSRQEISESSESEVAVKAAAASMYSTCNFLMSKADMHCF